MDSAAEIQLAAAALRSLGEARWERLSDWEVDAVRTGVRALPTKTPQGAMPFAGRIDSGGDPQHRCAQIDPRARVGYALESSYEGCRCQNIDMPPEFGLS